MPKSMDRKLVSKQVWEVYWISATKQIPLKIVRQAMKEAGRSRKKVYAWFDRHGWMNQPDKL